MLLLLASVDMLCAISLILALLGLPLPTLQAGSGLLLLLKALFFLGDLLSIIDIIVALSMFFLIWTSSTTLSLAIIAYLGYKSVASLL